jgi:DNA-binding transcriptional MerR regulator
MIVPEERSRLQTIAVICVKLDQGVPEEKIREYLDIEEELFAFCVEFALENSKHSSISRRYCRPKTTGYKESIEIAN